MIWIVKPIQAKNVPIQKNKQSPLNQLNLFKKKMFRKPHRDYRNRLTPPH